MSYKLIIHPQAEKDIRRLSSVIGKQVIKRLYKLAEDPRPPGYKKMAGYSSDRSQEKVCYRIRIGDLRAIYTIEDEIITVTILQVKKRGDIY